MSAFTDLPMRRRADLRNGLSVALLACLMAAGVAVALTARGGGANLLTRGEYEQDVRAAYAGVQASFASTRDVPAADLAARIEAAQGELRDAADRLSAVKPPTDVRLQNQALVDGMRAYAGNLDVLRRAAERQDARAVARFNAGLGANTAILQIAEAAEEMTFQGYDLGAIGEE
jgi:hypothetical protein